MGTPCASATPTRSRPRSASSTSTSRAKGRHEELYERLGAHPTSLDGVSGCAFAVWAPNARAISVVGDFNGWDGRLHQLRSLGGSGVWEIFVPGAGEGSHYKFEIRGQDGSLRLKVDPLAFAAEMPPKTASVVFRSRHEWTDGEWMERRAASDPWHEPMSVYEAHLGSWRLNPLEGNRQLTYDELGEELADYATDLGFTHVELLPVMEHPFYGSWGYQVTGFYAPTARFGDPDELRRLVDRLHRAGLGVILDWVPAHFPKDDWALAPLRRHRALRARGPAARRASRLGDARLQLRPGGGAQLPRRQRALLAATSSTSTGSASMRSRRCSTSTTRREARRVGAEHLRRPREPRGRRVRPRAQRRSCTGASRASLISPRSRRRGPA